MALDLAGWKPALLDGGTDGLHRKMAKRQGRTSFAFVGQEAYTTTARTAKPEKLAPSELWMDGLHRRMTKRQGRTSFAFVGQEAYTTDLIAQEFAEGAQPFDVVADCL